MNIISRQFVLHNLTPSVKKCGAGGEERRAESGVLCATFFFFFIPELGGEITLSVNNTWTLEVKKGMGGRKKSCWIPLIFKESPLHFRKASFLFAVF